MSQKSGFAQLHLGPAAAFWTVVLKGFPGCSRAAGGDCFALANPLSCLFSFFPLPVCLLFFLPIIPSVSLSGLALLNISSYVSDTFARISWNAGDSQQDSQFYVAYMNNRKLSSAASSCLDAVFLKQTIKVTTKSINQLQHQNCSAGHGQGPQQVSGTRLLCLSHYFYWGLGKLLIRSKVKSYQTSPVKFPLYTVVSRQWQFYICRWSVLIT